MVRMTSYSWGASASQSSRDTKKRPLPPSSLPPASKRRMSGPFQIDSDSEGERDDETDGDDGFNFDSHISTTQSAPARRKRDFLTSQESATSSLGTTVQQQESKPTPERHSSAPKPAITSNYGKNLNKGRFNSLMAKKQGNIGTQGLPQREASSDLKNQSSYSATTGGSSQSRSTSAAADWGAYTSSRPDQGLARPGKIGTSRQSMHSPTPSSAELTSRASRPGYPSRLQSPNDSPAPAMPPLNESRDPSQAVGSRSRKPSIGTVPQSNRANHCGQISPSCTPNSSSIPTNTARLNKMPHTSSLRRILEGAKEEHRNKPKMQNNVGSEWHEAQAERASARFVKNVHRPEVGARYGHTLTTKKTVASDVASRSKGGSAIISTQVYPSASMEISSPVQTDSQALRHPRTLSNNHKADLTSNVAAFADESSMHDSSRAAKSVKYKDSRPTNNALPPAQKTQLTALTINKQTPETQPVKLGRQRSEQTLKSSSTQKAPCLDTRFTAQKAIVKPQICSSRYHDADIRNSASLSIDRVAYPESMQSGNISETRPDDIDVSCSNAESVATQADSLSAGTFDAQPALQQSLVVATAPPEQLLTLPLTKDVAKKMDIYQKINTTHAADVSHSDSAGAGGAGRVQIPVAVMVRPAETREGPLFPENNSEESQSASLQALRGKIDRSTSIHDTSATSRSCRREKEAPIQKSSATEGCSVLTGYTAGDLNSSNLVDTCGTGRSSSSVYGEAAQLNSSPHSQDTNSQKRKPKSLEPIHATVPHLGVAGLMQDAGGTDEARKSSHPSSPERYRPLPAPARLISSPSPMSFRPDKTAQISSSQSIPTEKLAQQGPAINVSANEETASLARPATPTTRHTSELTSPATIKLPFPRISPTAEPYFEYTIHQALASWSSEVTTKISAHPLTSVDGANQQMERYVQMSKQQFAMLGMQMTDTIGQVNDDGLPTQQTTFRSHEDPSKAVTLKLWIERAEVGVHANQTPSASFAPPSIGRTVYAVRLWKLLKSSDDDEFDNAGNGEGQHEEDVGDEEKDESEGKEEEEEGEKRFARVYEPLPSICTEIHTTLVAANRAAKRVQIHLSHVEDPKSLQKQLQLQDLCMMQRKLEDLRNEAEDDDDGDEEEDGPASLPEYEHGRRRGCWRSVFKGPLEPGQSEAELDSYELLVCRVGVSGPRNL